MQLCQRAYLAQYLIHSKYSLNFSFSSFSSPLDFDLIGIRDMT